MEKFTVKHKKSGKQLYRGLTGRYEWALKAATDANKRDKTDSWVVYQVQDGEKR